MQKYLFNGALLLAGATQAAFAHANDTAPPALPQPNVTFVDPLAPSVIGHGGDLSPLGMFMAADSVVQGVILLLLLASLMTWVIGVAKWFQLKGERRRLAIAMRYLTEAKDLANVGETGHAPVADMIVQAEDEIVASGRSGVTVAAQGIKDRIAIRLDRISAGLRRHAGRSIGILAIISSTAPFLGLFGTVWGIMNSFIGIARSHTTSLAVVAPGIAEALLTTAVGLMAAIPAAILYNMFARILSNYASELGDAGATILCMAGREIDQAQGRE